MFTYHYEYEVVPVVGTSLFKVQKVQYATNQKARGAKRGPFRTKITTVPEMKRVEKSVADEYVFLKERQK